jgi:hypothetical protein
MNRPVRLNRVGVSSAWMTALTALATVAALSTVSACGGSVDVKQSFQVADLAGGWFDAGIENGKNKLVPTVSFRVRKNIDREVRPLSLNIHFKRLTQQGEEEWEEVFLQRVEVTGNQTDALTVRPRVGYTGDPPQSRSEMLQNSYFVDVRAVIFARQSSSNWVELARYDIPRLLVTQ